MLSINATVFVTFALVWILVLVLSRVFFKPVRRVLDERASRIEKAKAETEKTLAAYEQDLRRIEEGLKEARAAAAGIREQAALEALKEKSRLLQEIQVECRAQVDKAKAELGQRVEALKKELDATTEELSEDIERRILN
ncbi:MAG: ATP synthase F0 subunit B [Candidatus Aminicenantales bacterium]|jgi:F-type H+-transporting ATPase subunit b